MLNVLNTPRNTHSFFSQLHQLHKLCVLVGIENVDLITIFVVSFKIVGQRCTPCTQSLIIQVAHMVVITQRTVNIQSAISGIALTTHGEYSI